MKVRALPTCKKPVGEGAKRTRSGDELAEVDIGYSGLLMVRALQASVKPDSWMDLACNRMIQKEIQGLCLL